MDSLPITASEDYVLDIAGLRGLSTLRTVEGGCGGLELGVGLVGFSQNLLGFITGQALLSCELEGFEA